MNPKLVFQLIVLLLSLQVAAQEFKLELSQHPNKKAVIVAEHGIRKDTLGIVALDQNGKGTLAFKNKQLLPGLVNLTIIDKAYLSFDFVLSPTESPTLICDMEYVYAQNTKILNSLENECLNRWFDTAAQYKKRIKANNELNKLYTPEMSFSKQLVTEKLVVEKQLQKLKDTLNKSSLFAGKFMKLKLAQEEILIRIAESNEQKALVKNYFTQMDFETLYGSSLWFAMINTCLEAYQKEGPYFETFGKDVVSILKRTKNQEVYEEFLDAAISITERLYWNKDQEAIAEFIIKDNRIKDPKGKIQKIIESFKLTKGRKAPDLLLFNPLGENLKKRVEKKELKTTQLNSKYSLLLFYKSGCGSCETTLEGLKKNYETLLSKGIRIIAFSSDTDLNEFKTNATQFPWKDTYCDLEGTKGVNFKNYAVIGTPTMYFLDSKGLIISKMATLDELLEWVKRNVL